VATLGAPSCTAFRYTTGHTRFITRRCAGNGRTASMTWNLETRLIVRPPDVRAWRALFRIRLVDEGGRAGPRRFPPLGLGATPPPQPGGLPSSARRG
jgi:hypothetical protein